MRDGYTYDHYEAPKKKQEYAKPSTPYRPVTQTAYREKTSKVESLKKTGETAGRIATKIASGLDKTAERIAEVDMPKLGKGIAILSTVGMSIYLMGYAVSTALPYAIPMFASFGYLLGILVPLMFAMTVFSITIGLMKAVMS